MVLSTTASLRLERSMTGSDLFIRSFRGDVGPTIQRDESVDRFQIYRGKLDQSSLQSLLPSLRGQMARNTCPPANPVSSDSVN